MAEAFGIVSGSVGIATAFSACVECFRYVQVGRSFGRDVQTAMLTLSMLRLRLSRWGEAVHIYEDPQLGNPKATQDELKVASDVMFQMLNLFEDSSKVAKKYRLTAGQSTDVSTYTTRDMGERFASFENKMREMAARRQKKASLPKLTAWALYSRDQFSSLTENISVLLDNLERLFPAAHEEAVIAKEEVNQLQIESNNPDGKALLGLLKELSGEMDGVLQSQLEEVPQAKGHLLQHVELGENSRVRNGNVIASAWSQANRLRQGGNVTISSLKAGSGGKIHTGDTYIGDGSDDFW